MRISPLEATLGAVVDGGGARPRSPTTSGREIERAFHEHAVLVFPGQFLDQDEQVAFARRFGTDRGAVPGVRRGADHDRRAVRRGDGPRQPGDAGDPGQPGLAHRQLVHAGLGEGVDAVGPGGPDRRAARPSGPTCERPTTRSTTRPATRIAGLCAHHSIAYSQAKAGFDSTFGYGMDQPAQLRPLVKVHPVTGRPALFIGRHAHAIPGLEPDASDALLADLLERGLPAAARVPAPVGRPATSWSGTTAACCTAPANGTSPSRGRCATPASPATRRPRRRWARPTR